MKKTEQIVRLAQRLQWMREHRSLWEGLNPEKLYRSNRLAWRKIADGLKVAGLVSLKTSTIDVPVRKLIILVQQEELEKTEK